MILSPLELWVAIAGVAAAILGISALAHRLTDDDDRAMRAARRAQYLRDPARDRFRGRPWWQQ